MESNSSSERMPVLFVGHGSPMNAIEDNRWSRGFAELRGRVPQPAAILMISAHWYVDGTYLTGNVEPKTIHDFGGFPRALYEVEYPASGNVDLAERVRTLIGVDRAALSTEWGLDHGTWSVLCRMYPEAHVPVIQLSINHRLDPRSHYELGRSLADLRHYGVLIIGSGNIVHNLQHAFSQMRVATHVTPDWASRFDDDVKQAIIQHDINKLATIWPDTDDGQMAHPSPDHWLPLLYVMGAADDDDQASFPVEGFDWGSLSMRSVMLG